MECSVRTASSGNSFYLVRITSTESTHTNPGLLAWLCSPLSPRAWVPASSRDSPASCSVPVPVLCPLHSMQLPYVISPGSSLSPLYAWSLSCQPLLRETDRGSWCFCILDPEEDDILSPSSWSFCPFVETQTATLPGLTNWSISPKRRLGILPLIP